MTAMKCIELFAESIPGIIIQLSAIVNTINSGENVTIAAYLSLAVSLLMTGFISATLSYDFDTVSCLEDDDAEVQIKVKKVR